MSSVDTEAFSSLHVLVADDDTVMRNVIGSFLKTENHTVILAENGVQAIEAFDRDPDFDLFILDARMPGLDGLSVCARLKGKLERWVPVILISANIEESLHVEALDNGADYYLTKPLSLALLQACLRAACRVLTLQSEVYQKNNRLEDYYNQNRSDNDLARQLLDRMMYSAEVLSVGSRYVLDPAGEFSGDMILSMRSPGGRFYSMIADATGHGLPAAITLIPAVETFSRLAREGYSIDAIVRELNGQLWTGLPPDRFVAAVIMMFEPRSQRMEIWNGGCPTVYLVDNTSRSIGKKYPARHPPLGIMNSAQFDSTTVSASYSSQHTVVACTDGLTESEDPAGELFGKSRLEAVLESADRSSDLVTALSRAIGDFTGSNTASDDRSLLILPLATLQAEQTEPDSEFSESPGEVSAGSHVNPTFRATGGWHLALGLKGDMLRDTELAPIVNGLITRMGVAGETAQKAHVCIIELLNNAIDHGVLGLDSSLKSSPEGFETYFDERQRRLQVLREGSLSIRMDVDRAGQDYVLSVTVSDSGKGFGVNVEDGDGAEQPFIPSGRGIQLVRRLSDQLVFHDSGATAAFRIVKA